MLYPTVLLGPPNQGVQGVQGIFRQPFFDRETEGLEEDKPKPQPSKPTIGALCLVGIVNKMSPWVRKATYWAGKVWNFLIGALFLGPLAWDAGKFIWKEAARGIAAFSSPAEVTAPEPVRRAVAVAEKEPALLPYTRDITVPAIAGDSLRMDGIDFAENTCNAMRGGPGGMFLLAYRYESGQGVAIDYGRAWSWYEKAAIAGSAAALNNMGVMVYLGEGTNADRETAKAWFQAAAHRGNRRATKNWEYLETGGQ